MWSSWFVGNSPLGSPSPYRQHLRAHIRGVQDESLSLLFCFVGSLGLSCVAGGQPFTFGS